MADRIAEHLEERFNVKPAVRAVSGNGAHVLYRLLDLPPDEQTRATIRNCLAALHRDFSSDHVNVDTSVFNSARIWKIYGTISKKGDPLPTRPHRRSYILDENISKNSNICQLNDKALRSLSAGLERMTAHVIPTGDEEASEATDKPIFSKKGKKKSRNHNTPAERLGRLKVKQYLRAYNRKLVGEKRNGDTRIYKLKQCVFNHSHEPNDASIIQSEDGTLRYQCFHDSCDGKTWHDARKVISGRDSLAKYCEGYDPTWKMDQVKKIGRSQDNQDLKDFMYRTKSGAIAIDRKKLQDHLHDRFSPVINCDGTLYLYDADRGVWLSVNEHQIRSIVSHELGRAVSSARTREGVDLLMDRAYMPTEDFRADPMLLNLRNGMLDLRIRALSPHDPKYNSRIQLNVNYDEHAQCPMWIKALMEIFADDPDKISVLQQFTGYGLYPMILFPCAVLQIGSGGNGKGVVEHVLTMLLGEKNVCNISLSRMEKDFGVAGLRDKLLNCSAETESRPLEVANFKQISAGDRVQAPQKFKEDAIFYPIAKHLLSMNGYPTIKEKTAAFYRRIIVLEYNMRFDEKKRDDTLKHRIVEEELDGIFQWALDGLEFVIKEKRIAVPENVEENKRVFQERTNNIILFVKEICSLDKNAFIAPPDLYNAYKDWCDNSRLRPFGKQNFFEQIDLQFGIKRHATKRIGTRDCFTGIGLRAESEGVPRPPYNRGR